MMHFTVEEENLICMYHNADRRRTIGKITAAIPISTFTRLSLK